MRLSAHSALSLARPQHPTTRRVTRDPDVTGDGKVELDGEAEVEVGTADVDVAASMYVKPLIA